MNRLRRGLVWLVVVVIVFIFVATLVLEGTA